jgi:hypothetical protein
MDLMAFRASIQATEPPGSVSLPLQALWWDAKGDWNKAHVCAQADHGVAGAAVHAYLHRKEPDLANARHWYDRAGREPFVGDLDQEWESLAVGLLAA